MYIVHDTIYNLLHMRRATQSLVEYWYIEVMSACAYIGQITPEASSHDCSLAADDDD